LPHHGETVDDPSRACVFNPSPTIRSIEIVPGVTCHLIDDALTEPDRWVALAREHRDAFESAPFNAYPGVELRMPDPLSARLDAFFAEHIRKRLGARRTLRMYSRLAMATRAVDQLEPRQWICHRDRLDDGQDRVIGACVLYLFQDASLGGTAFFVPRKGARETAILIHESGQLAPADFTRKYGIAPSYPVASNDWFEKVGTVEAKWNRLVFYDGGALFHASDIVAPDRLVDDPASGRLTWNGFFVCRRAVHRDDEDR
jgi:hypothetical protein